MSAFQRRFLGLCLPPLLVCLLDNVLTLLGQPAGFWQGNIDLVNEASPTFHQLLAIHPLAFIAGGLIWVAVFVGFILLVPDTLALIASIAVTFGHTAGAATWLIWRFEYGYQACNGLFLLSALLLGLGIRHGWQARPSEEFPLRILPPVGRWLLAAALLAVAVYLFLWPRMP